MATVTIGVPCFNEKLNIEKLLDALMGQQDSRDIKIVQIIVIDESSDCTANLVEPYLKEDNRIKLLRHSSRRGKPAAINEIFANSRGDFVALFDADVLPGDNHAVLKLIEPMTKDLSIAVTGGAACALEPQNVMEHVAYFTYKVWRNLRQSFRGGSNFFSIHGKILAVSPAMAEQFRIPRGTIGDDGYIYLRCVSLGYRAHFVPDAIVYYQETSTLRDFLVRRTKYEHNLTQLIAIFGDLARREATIPRSELLRVSLVEGVRDPIGLFLSAPLVIWSKLHARVLQPKPLWTVATSTKQLNLRRIPKSG